MGEKPKRKTPGGNRGANVNNRAKGLVDKMKDYLIFARIFKEIFMSSDERISNRIINVLWGAVAVAGLYGVSALLEAVGALLGGFR